MSGRWPRGLVLLVKTRHVITSWHHLPPEHVRRRRDSKLRGYNHGSFSSPFIRLISPFPFVYTLIIVIVIVILFLFSLNPTFNHYTLDLHIKLFLARHRTLVSWRQGLRHPTRNECMSWFAQSPTLARVFVGMVS
jgi:hypothetical protein